MWEARRFLVVAVLALVLAPSAFGRSDVVRAGHARFEVLTPTLIRMEYAQDLKFENAPTLTVVRTRLPIPSFTATLKHGVLRIRTARLTLTYDTAAGAFTPSDLTLRFRVGGHATTVHPTAGSGPGTLGGWTRALDNQDGPVPLHPGILATSGWDVLDDSQTVLLTSGGNGFAPRPAHTGPYQDWYLFAYGHDYVTALADLRALTGPAPLLPRTAFGVWFSRYYPYSESEYHTLLAQFRSGQIPIDTLSVDTDWKHEDNAAGAVAGATLVGAPGLPYAWNGWEWDSTLFPNPQRFLNWAHSQGLSVALNIHPSIDTNDPLYAATVSKSGPLSPAGGECELLQADPTGTCMGFDWENPKQLAAYFALQRPLEQEGVDLFWLDWCCENVQPEITGLTPDTWINSRYAAEERARGLRWLAFSRIGAAYADDGVDGDRDEGDGGDGALAEHRYTIQFTGDTCATWAMLSFEAELSASEASIGLPYVSDDIGSYNGVPGNLPCGDSDVLGPAAASTHELPDDFYVRWVQFGTFQPIDRLHSNHGNRLPWEYDATADTAASIFLRLREALNPYIYTLARRSYDTGLPITGGLYLEWPGQAAAYQHPSEYTFGPNMVVTPVTAPGNPAPATIWVPPGTWFDYFTGQRFVGPETITLSVPFTQMPVLVRSGSILPTQPYAPYTSPGPNPKLILTAFPGGGGSFSLYDDSGLGFGYQHGAFTRTEITHTERGRHTTLTIGPTRGMFPGALRRRDWQVQLVGVPRPRLVTVDGKHRRFAYDAGDRTVTVLTGYVSTHQPVRIIASG
ncbi:MAG TPA: TIM-barrel domain-containing protein [Solirubrobacteraceae bacterium]|nr:TIM-barrel domain-containing protein [Solirubrobacteraceae bacterium]